VAFNCVEYVGIVCSTGVSALPVSEVNGHDFLQGAK